MANSTFADEYAVAADAIPSRYLGPVATASRIPNTFNSTNKQSMSTTRHIKRGTANTLQLLYWNGRCNAGSSSAEEAPRGSTATYKVSIEHPIGTQPRLFTWGGPITKNAADGELFASDEMPFDIPDGAPFFLHCYQTAAAGIVYTTFPITHQGTVFEGMTYAPSGIADATLVIGGDTARIGTDEFATPPLAILGWTRRPTVAIFADSRGAGTGSPGDVGDYTTNSGTFARSIGKSMGYLNLSVPSSRTVSLNSQNAIRFSLLQYVTSAVVCLGVNDYRVSGLNSTTIYNNLQLIVNQMVAAKPGLRVFGATIEPYCTASTDSYNSGAAGTQTPFAGGEATRTSVNDTLRLRGLLGAAGIIDIASALESGLNTGLWAAESNGAVNYPLTGDGLHANQRGALRVERLGFVNAALFVR